MKKYWILMLAAAILMQGVSAKPQKREKEDSTQKQNEKKEIEIGRNFLKISDVDSSVNVRIGNRGLSILESLEGGREIKIRKYEDQEDRENHDYWDNNGDHERRRNRFRGSWSGIEIGFNNYTASRQSQYIPDDIDYMTLHSGKSLNFNINFAQLSMGITRNIGFVTGLGLNWNNYRFDRNNNIVKTDGGTIGELDPGVQLKKSKFSTMYLTAPFLLEIHIPASHNHLNLTAGPIGAVKLRSHSKMVFEDDNKVKSDSDFNLNILRYGATARVGYSNLQVYGTYYVTPLFRKSDGPGGYDLFPFEIGLAFTFE